MTEIDLNTPVPVRIDWTEIKNWASQWAKPKVVARTTIRTYVIDPADSDHSRIQIAEYEPKRMRTAIHVIDSDVSLTLEVPVKSPDATTANTAPQGGYLPVRTEDYVFYGPDAMWLNALTAVTRVVVVKEYC